MGQRVTGNPLVTCGRCEYCLQGRDNLCADRTMVGMQRPGAFVQAMSTPAQCLIERPDSLAPVYAALTEPVATALHAVNLSMKSLVRPLPECRVLVLRGGAIGMLAALLLRHDAVDRLQVAALDRGVFGDLSWVARRPLAEAAQAFDDLHHGRIAAAKLVLEPAA